MPGIAPRAPRRRRRPRHRLRGGRRGRGRRRTTPAPSSTRHAASTLTIVLEPGRWIMAPAGALRRPRRRREAHPDGRTFVVLDAGMTELLRPALYGAFHRIVPVSRSDAAPRSSCDIVGPVCESSDTFGGTGRCPTRRWATSSPCSTPGAYGAVMASNYNRRPLPAEVLVDQGTLARHPPPPDRSTTCWRASHESRRRRADRLRGPRPERQGDPGAASAGAARGGRPARRPVRLPLLHRPPSRRRSRARWRANARTPPTCCSCSSSPTGTSTSRASRRRSPTGASCSAIATWRRASRTARRSASIPRGWPTCSACCRSPTSRCCSTSRRRPRRDARPRTAIASSATSPCSSACAPATAGRPSRGGVGRHRRRARAGGRGDGRHPRIPGAPGALTSRHGSVRATAITRISAAPASRKHARARRQRRARRPHVVHEHHAACPRHAVPAEPPAASRGRERGVHVGPPGRRRAATTCVGVRRRRRSAGSTGQPEVRRQLLRLVEAAAPAPARVQRHRDDDVRVVEHVRVPLADPAARGGGRPSGSGRT